MRLLQKITLITLFTALPMAVQAQEWHTSFNEARTVAGNESKNMILVFSGSDWCAPCIKLEKAIWESAEFKEESKNNWVLVRADFPKKKANALPKEQQDQNAALYEKYNKEGAFPLVVILDKSGKVLGKTAYKNISPKDYIALLHTLEQN